MRSLLLSQVRSKQFLQKTFCGEAAVGSGKLFIRYAFGCWTSGMSGAFVFDFNPSAKARISDLPQQCSVVRIALVAVCVEVERLGSHAFGKRQQGRKSRDSAQMLADFAEICFADFSEVGLLSHVVAEATLLSSLPATSHRTSPASVSAISVSPVLSRPT